MCIVRVPIGNMWFHQTECIEMDLVKGLLTKAEGCWKMAGKDAALHDY